MALAGEQRADGVDVVTARLAQRAKHDRARRLLAHDIGRRGALPERVVNKRGDGGAILRTRETMRHPPFLERVRRGATGLVDLSQYFDGGGNLGGGGHEAFGLKGRNRTRAATPSAFANRGEGWSPTTAAALQRRDRSRSNRPTRAKAAPGGRNRSMAGHRRHVGLDLVQSDVALFVLVDLERSSWRRAAFPPRPRRASACRRHPCRLP